MAYSSKLPLGPISILSTPAFSSTRHAGALTTPWFGRYFLQRPNGKQCPWRYLELLTLLNSPTVATSHFVERTSSLTDIRTALTRSKPHEATTNTTTETGSLRLFPPIPRSLQLSRLLRSFPSLLYSATPNLLLARCRRNEKSRSRFPPLLQSGRLLKFRLLLALSQGAIAENTGWLALSTAATTRPLSRIQTRTVRREIRYEMLALVSDRYALM